MKKNKEMVGATAKDLLETMNKLAGSAKLRKEVENDFKKRGMNIKIDPCGFGHMYLQLRVVSGKAHELQSWDESEHSNSSFKKYFIF